MDFSNRFYVFTGKGGVGKTSCSLAFTKLLLQKGKKAKYVSFAENPPINLCQKLNLPVISMNLHDSTTKYIAEKLGSKTIAGWIMSTPFFSSLFNMIPALGQMILLGHVIKLLEDDENLVVVLDSPSSGHAISMFEASHNFKKIFKRGMLVKDIERMHNFIYRDGVLKTVLVSLPTSMSVSECEELKAKLVDLKISDIELWINDILYLSGPIQNSARENLPEFLKTKIEMEQDVLEAAKSPSEILIPRIISDDRVKIVNGMITQLGCRS